MRSRISIRGFVGPSVRRFVRHTRVEFLRNGLNLNKIASGTWNYAIWKTIHRQVRGPIARTHLLSELCSTCSLLFRLNIVLVGRENLWGWPMPEIMVCQEWRILFGSFSFWIGYHGHASLENVWSMVNVMASQWVERRISWALVLNAFSRLYDRVRVYSSIRPSIHLSVGPSHTHGKKKWWEISGLSLDNRASGTWN